MIKFIYSEKAIKFCEISTLLLSYIVPVKSKVEISQNFEAFSEYSIYEHGSVVGVTNMKLKIELPFFPIPVSLYMTRPAYKKYPCLFLYLSQLAGCNRNRK